MSDSIKVAIKVRPLIKREKDENLQVQWAVINNCIVPVDPEKKRGESGFQFDHIFDSDKSNNHVFETVVKPIVDAAVGGFNGTVFAYGQTSSGKTHTMLGTRIEPGIIPMAVEYMFDSISETCGREFLLRVSYLEIHNEKVNDLLDTTRVDLKLREDNNGLVQVLNCKEDIANSPDLIMAIMKKGDKNRRIGETDMNEKSSRSHTIFRITIESRDQGSDSDGAIQVAQLNLVDLAGSERSKQTNTTGERFKEGTLINLSLTTLGLVIKQLSESSDPTKYINFRDSKLTRLLQASLGGNAMTVIICAVTPAAFEETQCTLSFASRAKSIKNKPQLNEVMSDAALLKRCKKQIAKLHAELEKAKHENRIADVEEMESKLQEKEHKLRETDRINQLLEERIHLLENNIISTNVARDLSNKKTLRSKRRRTWAGDRTLQARFSLSSEALPTIKENPNTSPDSKPLKIEISNNITRRTSIIQTVDFNKEKFEIAFTDFELDMIKDIQEREEETDITLELIDKNQFQKELRNENRVKFRDDVQIHRFSSGSNCSDISSPEKQNFFSNQDLSVHPPKLQEMLNYITEEYYTLQEYTILERQMFVEQQKFESSEEKIFMQRQIYELMERLRKQEIYQTELDEQVNLSLNCINKLISKTPDILNLWNQSLFNKKTDDVNTKLKELKELMTNLKNENNSGERILTAFEKQLTNDYNKCLQNLDEMKIEKEKILAENAKLKNDVLNESNKVKNANILINTLRVDTDCLMEKLLQKTNELSKLKERMVELERVNINSEKSIINELGTSLKKDCDVDLSIKLPVVSDVNKNDEILKLNEIIETKTKEIEKYKQLEEEMKTENKSLRQALDDVSKIVRIPKECQTETILDHDNEIKNEKNMINEINQQKNDDVTKLSQLIDEQNISIKNYKELVEEQNKKIKELHEYLDTNKIERISQECQTEFCENENNLFIDQTKNIKILNISKTIEENNVEIEKYDELEKEKKKKTELLQNFNISMKNEKKQNNNENCITEFKQLNFCSSINNETNDGSVKDIEVCRLENNQEKSLDMERSQFCLDNENQIEKTSEDIFDNKILQISDIKSVNDETYHESHDDIKLELEPSNEALEINSTTEQMYDVKQSEYFVSRHDIIDKYEDENNKKASQEIIEKCILELERSKEIEEMKSTIKCLQQRLNNVKTIEWRTVDCQTENLNIEEENAIDFNQEKNKEMEDLTKIIKAKELEIIQFKQSNEEKEKEIKRLQEYLDTVTNIQRVSKDCQMEYIFDTAEDTKTNTSEEKDKEILRLSKIIEEQSFKITVYKQKEIDCREDFLDTSIHIQTMSKACQTEYFSNMVRHSVVNEDEEKENEILKLSKIIEAKSLEIDSYKQLEEKMTKEIECLHQQSQNLIKLEHISNEVQTREKCECKNEKSIKQSDQIAQYEEKIEMLLATNIEFQEKVKLLNDKLIIKNKEIEELNFLINSLKNEIIEKTSEVSNVMQDIEIKVQKVEQKFNDAVLKKNELKAKIDSMYSADFTWNLQKDSERIINELKLENENLKDQIQTFNKECNNEVNLSVTKDTSLVMKSISKLSENILIQNVNNSVIEPMNDKQLKSEIEENIVPALDSTSFLKPDNTLLIEKKDSCTKLNMSAVVNNDKDFVKPLNKKCELESSSIFANMSYFDEMEVSQSFVQDCTASLMVNDETKDLINLSASVNTQTVHHVTIDEVAKDTSVLLEIGEKLVNVSVASPAKSKNESVALEEYERIKIQLEQENTKLRNDLEQKNQKMDEFQKCVTDVNQNLKELQQTVYKLTTENIELSKQLNNTKDMKDKLVKDLQSKVDTLTDRLSSITEEKVSLKHELEVLNEQFENMRAITPVITDEEMRTKIGGYQETITKLTEENIDLSTNLMEKIDELEKVKESKIYLFDHQCSFKEKCDNLKEQLEYLEKENIDLSNNLTDQIEEYDKLKEFSDVLQKQLEAYKSQVSSTNSNDDNPEYLKAENTRLECKLIELNEKLSQLTRENDSLVNVKLDISDDKNDESPNLNNSIMNATSQKLEISVHEDFNKELNNLSMNDQNKHLRKEMETLILRNKKLADLKLTNCDQCVHLKEINESRRNLKLEVQALNQKLAELEKKFKKKCFETENLRAKAKEDFNMSSTLLDATLNNSCYEGLNLTLIEEKVKNLQNELEESKENFKEKCNELEKLQLDRNCKSSIKKKDRRMESSTPSKNVRMNTLKDNLDKLSKDLKDIKKSNDNNTCTITKLKQDQNDKIQEIESLKLLNEELKKECDTEKSNALNSKEKVNLLEEELQVLYKRIEAANFSEKQIEAQKLEIELNFENLLKEKKELVSSLHDVEEKFRKELEDCNALVHKYDEENTNLKNELQKVEDSIQRLKEKNDNYSETKVQKELDSAKLRMTNEIKSLIGLSENERKKLLTKSVTDIFLSFVSAIISKEQEMVKKLHDDYEKSKRKLEDEKQQSIDSEKRTKAWAKTVEIDFEKVQADLTKQEQLNKRLQDQVKSLEEHVKDLQHENQQLINNMRNFEMDMSVLQNELEKKSKINDERGAVISAVEEKERIARSMEEEWEKRLRHQKEEYDRKLSELNMQLGSYRSLNEDLKGTIEGFDVQIEHLKKTIDFKANESDAYVREIETMMQNIDHLKEINKQLENENFEKCKAIAEITEVMKMKCDLLTEYKTKVETMKPEYESLKSQIAERELVIEKRKEEIHCLKLENKKEIDTLQDKLSTEQIKSEGLNIQLKELKNKNTTLYTTLEECKDRCGELERENANLQRKMRNSTSKVRVESEMKDLQDENRSLKNHLEGSYNRIKALQETKSQVQMELTEAQGKNSLLEQELITTKTALESLRDKYNNMNLQKLRDQYELLLREKNNIILEIEEKKMLIANKDQKLVECNIEIDTLKKQKLTLDKEMESIRIEKSLLEDKILQLVNNSDALKLKIMESNNQKDEIYKTCLEEKNQLIVQLENCQRELFEIQIKNKELNDEMDELVEHIQKQENENAELLDRLITGTIDEESVKKLKALEEDNEKLKIDLRVTELNRDKLQNEVVRLNTEKELLTNRMEDLNMKILELKSKNSSRSSSKSNSPTGRRRNRRSDLYNQNRNLDLDSDGRDITDTDSPSVTPTPAIHAIIEECQTCPELRNRIREMSLDQVTINNKITKLEVQLQAKEFPYQMKCNELQENLLALKTRNSELKLEVKKLQRALMDDCSRECHVCRYRKRNKRDQSAQANIEPKINLTGMSSGIVEDHLRLQKMEKERNWMKDLCRNRARKIKELEQYISELEGLKNC